MLMRGGKEGAGFGLLTDTLIRRDVRTSVQTYLAKVGTSHLASKQNYPSNLWCDTLASEESGGVPAGECV
jgi:hypothetical protein